MLVLFDHPMQTSADRRGYRELLTSLKALGFERKQLSVYLRHCDTSEQMAVLSKGVERIAAESVGVIDIIRLSDRQFHQVPSFIGGQKKLDPAKSQQLAFF